MPQNKASLSKATYQGSDMGIKAQSVLSPIVEETGRNPPPPIAAEFENLRDLVIRNTHQMEEMRVWMKKVEEDRNSDRKEFKSMLLDVHLKSVTGSCDRGPGLPSPRSESIHLTHGDRSINTNRESPLLPTLSHFPNFTQVTPPPPTNYSYSSTYRPTECTYEHKSWPEFPLFTDKDIHGWLYRVEQLLEFYNTSPDKRVRMASLFLDEKPLQWYRWSVTEKGGPLEWDEFVQGLVSMYDPSHTISYEGEPSKLKQEGLSYDDYQAEFMRLSHHVHGLSCSYLMNFKFEVMAKKPTTVGETMRLAKLEEEKTSAIKKSSKGGTTKGFATISTGSYNGSGVVTKPNTSSNNVAS